MNIRQSIQFHDTWTHSKDYAARYQTLEQISETISCLQLIKTGSLLDIGCGNGAFSIAVAKKFPECKIFAVDALESAVQECQKRVIEAKLENVFVKQAFVENLPFPNSAVERLLIRNVLHHLATDIDVVLKELSRVLGFGGFMVIEAPCNLGDKALGDLISDLYFLMDDSHRRTFHHPDLISEILTKYGFETQLTKLWTWPSNISPECVSLIKKHQQQNQLGLKQRKSGEWGIKLNVMRIIAKKKMY